MTKTGSRGKLFAIIGVAADSDFEIHEKMMSWLKVYVAAFIAKVRVYAREKGDLERGLNEIQKLRCFAEETAAKNRLRKAA